MGKFIVYGKVIEGYNQAAVSGLEDFEVVKKITMETTRAHTQREEIVYDENDIVQLDFTDGTQWLGNATDIPEIYRKREAASRGGDVFVLDAQLNPEGGSRGLGTVIAKAMQLIKPKVVVDAAEKSAHLLAVHYDNKVMPAPGLFKLGKNMQYEAIKEVSGMEAPQLLMIHGTLSNTFAAFGDLVEGENSVWQQLEDFYNSPILALEHKTLSVSPLQNALDFISYCKRGVKLDILTHSRGGLIADILAKCDHRNKTIGFSEDELQLVEKTDEFSHKLMKAINETAVPLKLQVNKVIRVAAPASGTTLLSERLDHFLNVVLNALGLAFGSKANVLYGLAKSFLLEVLKQKASPEQMAGLNSMMPESAFQQMLNYSQNAVVNELYVISGDAEVGGVNLASLKVILANLFYWKSNDLVVDTHRMEHGVLRSAGIFKYLSRSKDANHFSYFKNADSCDALLQAVTTKASEVPAHFTYLPKMDSQRGIVLDLFSMKGVFYDEVSGNRPIAVVIPGIMGSSLDSHGEPQWIDLKEMHRGCIAENLGIDAPNVTASGVIRKYYDDFIQHLMKTHDVVTFPFDWRKSVSGTVENLSEKISGFLELGQPVHIVAHSMGGLVARQVMIDKPDVWQEFSAKKENKFVMLGTPWLGSYLIMEVLTGHSARVKQLAMIDFKNNLKKLLNVFHKYPGVYELLPVEQNGDRKFWTKKFWDTIEKELNDELLIPPKEERDHFGQFQKKVSDFVTALNSEDFENIYYIAGKAKETVFDYEFKSRFLSKKKKLVYLATPEGDGSVTWKTGIPEKLPKDHLYYTEISHGALANAPEIFDGITDILQNGKTLKLSQNPPTTREVAKITEIHSAPEPVYDVDRVGELLFGIEPKLGDEAISTPPINVSVVNADLRVGSYPVMVGHFYNDSVYSAEKALDGYLDGRLTQRYEMGYYPGKVGESEVFFNLKTNPRGAIVCGLGESQGLTSYLLAKSVEMAVLKYAMFMRDNYTLPKAKKYAEGVSCILIGTGYGNLQIEDSVKGILLGVSQANRYIQEQGNGLQLIINLEFVNYYQSLASQAYWALTELKGADNRVNFNLIKGLKKKEGAKKRRSFVDDNEDWWHVLEVERIPDADDADATVGFRYNSSGGLARIEEEKVYNGLGQLAILLERLAGDTVWDKKLSKTLFELLIPNQFKDIIRNQNNIALKLDEAAAQFPWELFHDYETDVTPASVNSGLLRQLNTSDYIPLGLRSPSKEVLVIGDPLYDREGLPPLPAAKKEAEMVGSKLDTSKYKVTQLIRSKSTEIMMALYTANFKILHFSGHGLYDPEHNAVGIAIGDRICITPAMFKQLSYVPEFVFINCCYSGVVDVADQKFSQYRYKLAANIGTQLINMGVRAIIITGWAVNDAAAKVFSEVFYSKMLAGYEFGTAVQEARKQCYQKYRDTNTWGAYQCYGNQYYRFQDQVRAKKERYDYVLVDQVYVDMDNLYSSIRHRDTTEEDILQQLANILKKAKENGLIDGAVREKEALIYDELGKFTEALQTFEDVLSLENANFSMQVLERFCLLRSLHLPQEKEKREADFHQITKLDLIGKTTTRLGIVGNAYKFNSLFGDTDKWDNLQKAFQKYKEAHNLSLDRYDGPSLDAFSNMVILALILEPKGLFDVAELLTEKKAEENDNRAELLADYVASFRKLVEQVDKDEKDISVLIGMAEIGICQILLADSAKKEQQALEEINSYFEKAYKLLNSKRHILMEEKQMDFLIAQDFSVEKKKLLEAVKTGLRRYL
ncbi:MAG: CHAT domain-containing protein [Leeuwenhoekiella sp.]